MPGRTAFLSPLWFSIRTNFRLCMWRSSVAMSPREKNRTDWAAVRLYFHGRPSHPEDRLKPGKNSFLLSKLKLEFRKLVKVEVIEYGPLQARLWFEDNGAAVDAVVHLWELRLQGAHNLTPEFDNVAQDVESEMKIEEQIRVSFLVHMGKLAKSELVESWEEKAARLKHDIDLVKNKLHRMHSLREWQALQKQKHDLCPQYGHIVLALEEFVKAVSVIEAHVNGRGSDCVNESDCGECWPLIKLSRTCSWHQICCILEREVKRLEVALPLYAWREYILDKIKNNKVVLLVGETGSGKSTQLVQYLADAGLCSNGKAIICTQPRKLAAISLAKRVQEECAGCYPPDVLVSCSYPKHEDFPAITFTTDFMLLQLCLKENALNQFSCIVVDEAHERSLHTDLLLATLKGLLNKFPNLKLVIMSATVDAGQLSEYFGGCIALYVNGRHFPVDIKYEPYGTIDKHFEHVNQVVQKVASLYAEYEEGNILAFLTSQADVEWACSQMINLSALVLPMHGRLSPELQQRVFEEPAHNMRKIIFSTNIAETSLTIPGIRFVVDSGLVKRRMFDPLSGMSSLKVCLTDKGSATQRAGRAGRTGPGICFRLYSELEFQTMDKHRIPEILTVPLTLSMLKLLAFGVKDFESFDFIEAPDPNSISHAVNELRQLGAIRWQGDWCLTELGSGLVKLGIEPRLGKIILDSRAQGFIREGLIVAAFLSCGGSIFYRTGTEEEKDRSDRLKMRFCHPHGDLLTFLFAYQEWDATPTKLQKAWCLANSINYRAMKNCKETAIELQLCLKHELGMDMCLDWNLTPETSAELSAGFRKIILSSMLGNLAIYSGNERLGYNVIAMGKLAHLHPASAVLVHGYYPEWIVFGEFLCTSMQYLVSVTPIEPEWISEFEENTGYDVSLLKHQVLRKEVISNLGTALVRRIRGRNNKGLQYIYQLLKQEISGRCILELRKNELDIYATGEHIAHAKVVVSREVARIRRWVQNACIEKSLYETSTGINAPGMLFGTGGMIREIIMPGEYATVEVFYPVDCTIELLSLFDECGDGLAGFRQWQQPHNEQGQFDRKWGEVSLRSFRSAESAVRTLSGKLLGNHNIKVVPLMRTDSTEGAKANFPVVRAALTWPRCPSKGFAFIECAEEDTETIIRACSGKLICNSFVSCHRDRGRADQIFMHGLGANVMQNELKHGICYHTDRPVVSVRIPRDYAASNPSTAQCQALLFEKLQDYLPSDKFQVTVQEKQQCFKAVIKFDEGIHEAAKEAIASLEGKPLSICQSWQTVTCEPMFYSSVMCHGRMLKVLIMELKRAMESMRHKFPGLILTSEPSRNGGLRVEISARSLEIVARCKSSLEMVLEGKIVEDPKLDKPLLQILFSHDGMSLLKEVEFQTSTFIFSDKRTNTVKIYGPSSMKDTALEKIVAGLLKLHEEDKCERVYLRGNGLPQGLMRAVVKCFGVDLSDLKETAGVRLTLNHRQHSLFVYGEDEARSQVKKAIAQVAEELKGTGKQTPFLASGNDDCPICFCPIEDKYYLESCGHGFCKLCLVNQISSATRHREGFPLTCAHEGCIEKMVLADFSALLSPEQEDELQKASLSVFVAASRGAYKFCSTPDCPSVYRTSSSGKIFKCAACSARLCTSCHVEYHEGLSCDLYHRYKENPDASLDAWRVGKEDVKNCPCCGSTIEKVDGCNHVTCKCGKHVCWVCLESFVDSSACYAHMAELHGGYL